MKKNHHIFFCRELSHFFRCVVAKHQSVSCFIAVCIFLSVEFSCLLLQSPSGPSVCISDRIPHFKMHLVNEERRREQLNITQLHKKLLF